MRRAESGWLHPVLPSTLVNNAVNACVGLAGQVTSAPSCPFPPLGPRAGGGAGGSTTPQLRPSAPPPAPAPPQTGPLANAVSVPALRYLLFTPQTDTPSPLPNPPPPHARALKHACHAPGNDKRRQQFAIWEGFCIRRAPDDLTGLHCTALPVPVPPPSTSWRAESGGGALALAGQCWAPSRPPSSGTKCDTPTAEKHKYTHTHSRARASECLAATAAAAGMSSGCNHDPDQISQPRQRNPTPPTRRARARSPSSCPTSTSTSKLPRLLCFPVSGHSLPWGRFRLNTHHAVIKPCPARGHPFNTSPPHRRTHAPSAISEFSNARLPPSLAPSHLWGPTCPPAAPLLVGRRVERQLQIRIQIQI
ncbi:hypothetical protein PLESTB_000959200 [Pleodorina starrii]|uniref:Uncharacterized protein n=1 Tax=Pleodorina starrii TaxID=330485 RepID=A0A9W6C512_9CHLO|nr:hypothetical protein PLESTB_000959200 [Pleodorina starrii]